MNKHIMKRLCGGLLTAALVLTAAVPPGTAAWAASTPKDIKGHWAQKNIEKTISAGIVSGYKDGTFRPDAPVTRAEFCHMVNATLGNTGTVSISFKDVPSSEWYYSDVSKAVAAGFVSGYTDNKFKPDQRISRQEAAVILSRIVPISNSAASLSKYSDNKNIDNWAKASLEYMVGKKYITTYSDGRIHPKDNMTRAQAATIISNVLSNEKIVKTDPNVTKDGTKLADTIYANGVTISKSLDDGDATLTNCVVLGTLNVLGGNTVTLNDSRVAIASVQKSSDSVRLTAKGNTSVKTSSAAKKATLDSKSASGNEDFGIGFETTNVTSDAEATLYGGTFPTVNVNGSYSNTKLTNGKITTLNVNSGGKKSDITIESGTSVALANVNAESYFHGTGTITKMSVNADNVTYEKKPGTITSGNSNKPGEVDAALTISPNPSSGKSGVKIDTEIKLTFNRAIKLHNGSSIGKSDIEDFVQLRKKTSSGSKVDFSASIDSAKKVITITPDSNLDEDTKYYIVIDKNELKDSEGNSNAAFSSYFTTDDEVSGYMSFTPRNGATGVSVSKDLTIKFSEKMMNYDGSNISKSDLSSIISFRKSSSSGTKVSYTATIDSAKKVITIEPSSKLDENTKYYLAVNSKSLKTYSGEKVVPGQSITFTTVRSEVSDYCTFYPKNSATGVSRTIKPTLSFTEKMVLYDRDSISNSDIKNIVSFRNTTQGKDVPFTGTINSAKTQITISPTSSLPEGCKFTLSLNSKSIRTAKDYDVVPSASVSWSTSGTLPQASLTVNSNEDTITVSASGTMAGTIYAVLLPGSASTPSDTQVIAGKDSSGNPALGSLSAAVSANTSKELGKFADLSAKTSYKVCVVLKPSSSSYSNSSVATKTISTSDRPGSTLSNLSVSYGGRTEKVGLTSSKTEYTVEVPFGTSRVTVSASTDGGNTRVGNSSLSSGSVEQSMDVGGGDNKITVVSNKSGLYDTEYTLIVKVKGNTALKSVTADSRELSASGTTYKYEIPADQDSTEIVIESEDSDAVIESGVKGRGRLRLSGINEAQTIDITVTSNGDDKSYSLVITKAASAKPSEVPDTTPSSIQ